MLKQFTAFVFLVTVCFQGSSQTVKLKLTEHTANIEAIAYSPNGQYFVSSGWDGAVNLYTIDSMGLPKFKQSFLGHLGAVTSLNFSKNSRYIISCGKDYSARVWNIDTPNLSKVFSLHFEPVTCAFLDQSGKFLITSSTDGTIKTTSVSDSKKSKTIKVGKSISDLLLSKDNKYYYASVKGGTIMKIETGSTKIIEEMTGHKDEVNALDISPDGRILASAGNDKVIILWDLTTGKELRKLNGFEWKVTSVEFSADGKYVIGGCNEGTTKLFDAETGKLVSDFKESSKNVRDVAFNNNGTQIAIATNLDGDRFGAVIYSSGVTAGKPEPGAGKGKTPVKPGAAKPAATTPSAKPKSPTAKK